MLRCTTTLILLLATAAHALQAVSVVFSPRGGVAPPRARSAVLQAQPDVVAASDAVDAEATEGVVAPVMDATTLEAPPTVTVVSWYDSGVRLVPDKVKPKKELSPEALLNRQLVRAKDTEVILSIVAESHEQMTVINIATAQHRLAVLNKKARARRDRVLRDPRFALLVDATEENAAQFSARSASDVLWSSATLQHWPPRLLKPVLTGVATQLSAKTFEAQHLSTMTWALAKLKTKPVRLLEQFEEQAIPKVDAMDMQNCANLLWGFATLRYSLRADLGLLAQLSESMLRRGIIEHAKPVEVADLATALAFLCTPASYPSELLLALASRASPDALLPRFSSRQLVGLLVAVKRLDAAGSLPDGLVDAWVSSVRATHLATPLLASDADKLESTLQGLGIDASWVKQSAMLNTWTDLAEGGTISRSSRSYTDEELRATFDAIDADGSGDIDQAELRAAIRQINPEAEDATVNQMLDFADVDGDREVSFEEFKKIMRGRPAGGSKGQENAPAAAA